MEKENKKSKTNLEKYLRARRPIIWVRSSDYKEIDDIFNEAVKEYDNKAVYEYRALGAVDFETKVIRDEIENFYQMLDILFSEGAEKNVFLIIKNADKEIETPENLAYIKKISELRYANPDYNFTFIIVSESGTVPKELEKFTSVLDIPNMTKEEIKEYIEKFAKVNGVNVDKNDIGEISISLKGLTKLEIDHVLNMMIEGKKNISISDRQIIIREKGQIIKKSAVLEIIDFKERIEDIGGLEGLKEWLKSKAEVFRKLDEARKFGVDVPKGVLLVGMPGCGKSLAAKASARLFNTPLLRLDIGRLLGKYVGESEHNMRVALKTAESISPCILWIDEIEKAFAGIDQGSGASDITKRLFGQFLTWLQEKENTVFVVATANDISAFPPEFLRKGRFDEVFFIDFPEKQERERIFEIHLEKRGQKSENFDCEKLASISNGYCGADIEEAIKITMEKAFVKGNKKITTEDVIKSVKEIDSLSSILKDKIDTLKKGYEKFKIKSATKIVENKTKSKNKDMVFVKGGKYTPSFFNEEREVFDLEVSKYLVTQENWENIMGKNPSQFLGKRRPVDHVSWIDALRYCNALSKKEGLKPVYIFKEDEKNDIENLKIHQLSTDENVSASIADFKDTEGYRLPTELEWEWIARGGETAIQNGTFDTKYAGSDNIDEVAWYEDNAKGESFEVGMKKPNELGIYDMSGNLYEWCYDVGDNDAKFSFSESRVVEYIDKGKTYKYDNISKYRILKGGDFAEREDIFKKHTDFYGSRFHKGYAAKSGMILTGYTYNGEMNCGYGFRVVKTVI